MEINSNQETLEFIRHKLKKPNLDKDNFAYFIPFAELMIFMEFLEARRNLVILDIIQARLHMQMVATNRVVGSPNKLENIAKFIGMTDRI